MSIFDVRHQPRAQRTLQRALQCGRVPHAYLFAGPEGVGREMLAWRMARVLLCARPLSQPMPAEVAAGVEGDAALPAEAVDACGDCTDCRLVQAETHPDLHPIYRQLNRQHPDSEVRKKKAVDISVDVIRKFLIEKAGTRPMQARAKVFVVREAERLTPGAQNALLKTLEEPPRDTFIILITSALDRMLATTRSRCQQIVLQALPETFTREQLAALRPDASPEAVAFAAAHSGGSLGTGLRLIDDGVHKLKRAWGPRLLELITPRRGFAPHALAKPLSEDGKQLAAKVAELDPEVTDLVALRAGVRMLMGAISSFHADALRRTAGASACRVNEDQVEVVDALVKCCGSDGLLRAISAFAEAERNLDQNANIDLVLETLMIRLSRTAASAAG